MPRKKEVVEKGKEKEKEKELAVSSQSFEKMYGKIEKIERLTIIVWSLSILTFMLTMFCLFK